jgi:hypothetical protein
MHKFIGQDVQHDSANCSATASWGRLPHFGLAPRASASSLHVRELNSLLLAVGCQPGLHGAQLCSFPAIRYRQLVAAALLI